MCYQENQVAALKEKGIAAEYLSSTQTSSTKNKVKCGNFDIFLLLVPLCLWLKIWGKLWVLVTMRNC